LLGLTFQHLMLCDQQRTDEHKISPKAGLEGVTECWEVASPVRNKRSVTRRRLLYVYRPPKAQAYVIFVFFTYASAEPWCSWTGEPGWDFLHKRRRAPAVCIFVCKRWKSRYENPFDQTLPKPLWVWKRAFEGRRCKNFPAQHTKTRGPEG